MKRFHITLTSLLVAFGAMLSTAHADIKVASVNMQELNLMFYKRDQAEKSLSEQKAKIEEEIKQHSEKAASLAQELEKLKQQADPTLSESQQKALQQKAVTLSNEFQAAREELNTFMQRRQAAFNEVARRELSLIANELHETVAAVAAEGQYDLVIDSSAVSAHPGAKVYPYVKPSLDISNEVLKRLNADAPSDFDPQALLQRMRNAAPAATEGAAQ